MLKKLSALVTPLIVQIIFVLTGNECDHIVIHPFSFLSACKYPYIICSVTALSLLIVIILLLWYCLSGKE